MSADDIENIFETLMLAQPSQDLNYLTISKTQNSPMTNHQSTYDSVEEDDKVEEQAVNIIPIKVIGEISNDFPDISLEPSTEEFISTVDNLFLEEHNYALKDINAEIQDNLNEYSIRIFANLTSLGRHLKNRTKEKPCQCKICGKFFSQQSNLWKHIRVHTGERPFECPQCKRKFSQRANMKKHMMIHSGEKPFKCPYCWRCFTQLANLNKHVLLHIGVQPYKCKYCDKGFFQLSNMRKHEYIHEGVKPYSCPYCRVSYTQHSNLKKHLAVHTEKPNVCEECGKSYAKKENLTEHQKYCNGEIFLNMETNKLVKIIQTDDSKQMYCITENNVVVKFEIDPESPLL